MKIEQIINDLKEWVKTRKKYVVTKDDLRIFLIKKGVNSAVYNHILNSYLETVFTFLENDGYGIFDRRKKTFTFDPTLFGDSNDNNG